MRFPFEYYQFNFVANSLSMSVPREGNCLLYQRNVLLWNFPECFLKRDRLLPAALHFSRFQHFPVLACVRGSSTDSYVSLGNKYSKEGERRRKIGLANKGKVPWNKGRKHTEEARMRIRQRTIEALRDPKVRKRMSEHPKLHSKETKEKIRSSLKRIWSRRLKSKRIGEKFISLWSESIAGAAKKGGADQQALDWNSYEKLKQDIALEQINLAAQKEKTKELARLRAEKRALMKAENTKRLAQRRKEREEIARARKEREPRKNVRKAKTSNAIDSERRLRRRLTKIQRRKPVFASIAAARRSSVISILPNDLKLDIDFVENERKRGEVSLADQIQAAKHRRASSTAVQLPAS